jgi:Uma2 family endonuclease
MAMIPGIAPSRHLMSVDAFHRMGEVGILGPTDRVELIGGEIISLSPIGVLHAAIVARLASHFARQLGDAAVVWCQNPLRLDDLNEPEPDLAVLRPRDDFYMTSHPGPDDVLLVVEVSDTSLAYDLGMKVPLYAQHAIPEVWVIDAVTQQTRVFRKPIESGYAHEESRNPEQPLWCEAITDAAMGGHVIVELQRLLPRR